MTDIDSGVRRPDIRRDGTPTEDGGEGGSQVDDDPNDRPAGSDPGPPERPPFSVGRALAEARAASGLSIEDVAATTRIRAALVHAIEQDDFSACGGAFYARAHVRSIARVVDADADRLVEEYDRQHGGPPTRATDLATSTTLSHPADAATRRPASRWAAAAIAVIGILVIVLISQLLLHDSDDKGNQTNPPPATKSSTTPSHTPSHSQSASHSPSHPAPPPAHSTPSGVSVAVVVSVRSWVQVTSSAGAEVYQGVLEAGQNRTFTDTRALTMRFGNAGGVTVSLNGQPAKPPCEQSVCTVQFTPQSGSAAG